MEAKATFMEAFFDELKEQIEFLRELYGSDRRHEAMLLCCCYIDGLASNYYHQDEGSHRNFTRVIREFGQEGFLTRIHPRQLRESLQKLRGSRAEDALSALDEILPSDEPELPAEEALIARMDTGVEPSVGEWLKDQLWRGTLASVAYTRLRVPSVHGLRAPSAIAFDDSRIDGQPVPTITFDILYSVLIKVYEALRTISLETGRWFGHDFRAE